VHPEERWAKALGFYNPDGLLDAAISMLTFRPTAALTSPLSEPGAPHEFGFSATRLERRSEDRGEGVARKVYVAVRFRAPMWQSVSNAREVPFRNGRVVFVQQYSLASGLKFPLYPMISALRWLPTPRQAPDGGSEHVLVFNPRLAEHFYARCHVLSLGVQLVPERHVCWWNEDLSWGRREA